VLLREGKDWEETLKEMTYTPLILILADSDIASLR